MLLVRRALVARLAEDLRTVAVLLTGRRLTAAVCRRRVERVFAGGASPCDEAVVYLLATHLLALDERDVLDLLAWRWLAQRDGSGTWTPRTAAEALRLAVFYVESGWSERTFATLVGLVLQSRTSSHWLDLSDLARTGGRHGGQLESVVRGAVVGDCAVPATRAALLMLARSADLPAQRVSLGTGWVIVSNAAPGREFGTLFTWSRAVPADAQLEMWRVIRRDGLSMGVHGYGLRVSRLPAEPWSRPVVPLRAPRPLQHVLDVRGTAQRRVGANLPPLLSLPYQRVLGVFSIGASVVGDARWLATGGTARRAR